MYKVLSILLFTYSLAVTSDDIYDNSYALLIGIDKYKNVPSLDYAVKDAEDIQSMLVHKFHFQKDNIILLANEKATKATIIQEFSNITKKAGINDRILIFFAGHGTTEDLPGGGEMGYLMPVNGNEADLYVSAIKMDEIKTISLRSQAKHILYLVDACFSGVAAVGSRGLTISEAPNYIEKITRDKSRQIISAGGRDEKVVEKAEWGHSAFTKNLLSGLRDSKADTDQDGIITAQELGLYLKRKVTADSGNEQTPQIRNLTTDEGEFIFVLPEHINTVQTKSSPSSNQQLDLILSKLEKLESQQNMDMPSKEQNNIVINRKIVPAWQNKLGAGFFATSTMTAFEFYNIIYDHLEYSLKYEHSLNKISSSLIGTQSNQMHLGQLSVIYSPIFTESSRFFLGGGLGYTQVLWSDSSLDFNYVKTSLICGIGVKLIQIKKPISTQLGCKLFFELSDLPKLDEYGKVFFDKKFETEPKIIFLISFPK